MKKIVFLYSGEGTRNAQSSLQLIRTSSYWQEIADILKEKWSLSLEDLWGDADIHRCPHSPLLTVAAEICLTDIWNRWGYSPDIVIGHSVGELAAAYQAGLYSLEEILLLSYAIGKVAAKLEGTMFHGLLTDEQIAGLTVPVSSINFIRDGKKHVTVSCSNQEAEAFLASHPDFHEMQPPHPWHHRNYGDFLGEFPVFSSAQSSQVSFCSGVTTRFEQQLEPHHWQNWLTRPIDFISTMKRLEEQFPQHGFQIIEVGFHSVLESCCQVLQSYEYSSSMYRGEDEIKWIVFQRKQLDQKPFLGRLTEIINRFHSELDFNIPLAYQGFTSLKFVEFAAHLRPFFPGLAPQDFYRFKSIQQLIDGFGKESAATVAPLSKAQDNRVVISAMSCKFPAAVETPVQFWEMLLRREDQVTFDRQRGDYQAGFLDSQVTRFDHKYFNIAEAEAKTMDPQQILALELTELLWRDAGIDPETLDKKRVGVYLGAWNEEYRGNQESVYYPTGTNPSIIASRISYHYDLRGPSWVANTACSSSLLAIHYACKDIEAGRIDYAIAGGVNMLLGNAYTHSMRDSGFLSVDGRCKAFDDSANGYVRAEGGGLVLLVNKDLAAKYYAEILGSSVNQNGGRPGVITAPHPEAQEELIRDACQDASIVPQDITYVECHGTGTKIGDPIEISALQNTVAKDRASDCYLGSVKSNMGHLESAAGIAGLLKSVLALHHGRIPANLHFNTPNQFIDFSSYNLRVVDQEIPIGHEALVGVSSFGFGGANAHIIIKGAGDDIRKSLENITVPFDKNRATPLSSYYQLEQTGEQPVGDDLSPQGVGVNVREVIQQILFEVTGIKEIDPEVDLTDQGLDSLSATEFVTRLQGALNIDLEADLLYDYPFIDQLVTFLEEKVPALPGNPEETITMSRENIAEMISAMFYELTNIQGIDPDIELTDQGLDSLGGTQLITQLEAQLKIEIDTDILYDYPLYDQLVDKIHAEAIG